MRSIVIVCVLLTPWAASAGEREWQPALLGTVGALRRDGGTSIGFGADASAGYHFTDWLQLEVHLAGAQFPNVEAANGKGSGEAYAATRLQTTPMLRLTPGASLLPQHLGDWFVPSVAIGAGYTFEHQTERRTLLNGRKRKVLEDRWDASPDLVLGVGADFRFAKRFTAGLRVRASTPIGKGFAQCFEFNGGLAVGFLFYP